MQPASRNAGKTLDSLPRPEGRTTAAAFTDLNTTKTTGELPQQPPNEDNEDHWTTTAAVS